MKYWSYSIPIINEYGSYNDYYILSEEEILDEYWEYWSQLMIKKYGEGHELITKEQCIDDWVVLHWAMELTE